PHGNNHRNAGGSDGYLAECDGRHRGGNARDAVRYEERRCAGGSDRMNLADLEPYVQYKTARSGGSGGQHVNKAETKAVLLFDGDAAAVLTPTERERIKLRLAARMQADGRIQVQSQ